MSTPCTFTLHTSPHTEEEWVLKKFPGFGVVMIEAMACGAPVLAVRRGSVAEVVDEGITGFTASTPAELAPLVAQTCALDRRKVREHAAARFSHTKMVDDYLAHYRELIAPSQ